MGFERQKSESWKREVPGTRWFKADLHIHTIDDIAGGGAKIPSCIRGAVDESTKIDDYATCFLRSAVKRGIQVLGVTPHSPRFGTSNDLSAVWKIVDKWNFAVDDDDVPFREKIYAIFPGFESSLKDGSSGLHMLFLFDPEIGFERYLRAFDQVMGGVSPWSEQHGNNLQISNNSSEQAFDDLSKFYQRESGGSGSNESHWDYMVLAPHIDSDKGLLNAQKAQVLQLFQHHQVAALELGDEQLAEDALQNREAWLPEAMHHHRQAFFHSSDAYAIDDIGRRYSWIKMASPTVEALRQAFIANASRVRIGFERDSDGKLVSISNPPDIANNKRPWLKSVEISGSASFFGTEDQMDEVTRFDFSPDFNCVIGGSMTGKSTLLDGLRVYIDAPMPQDSNVREHVEGRGKKRFLGGDANVVLECPGQDPTGPWYEQWPAEFYTQNELQRLADSPDTAERILTKLAASKTAEITDRETRLTAVDRELSMQAQHLNEIEEQLVEAQQAFERSKNAVTELATFSDAGVDDLNEAMGTMHLLKDHLNDSRKLLSDLDELVREATQTDLPSMNDSSKFVLKEAGIADAESKLRSYHQQVLQHLLSAQKVASAADADGRSFLRVLSNRAEMISVSVNRALAARGIDADRINQLQALNAQASLCATYEAHVNETHRNLANISKQFEKSIEKRRDTLKQQREAFDRVIDKIKSQFDGRISARRIDHGQNDSLARFIRDMGQRGITRWWNDSGERRPSSEALLQHIATENLSAVGMSAAVQESFLRALTPAKKRELKALRCKDLYVLEFGTDNGSYRPLKDLSGGLRVNLLLSLLLETQDDRPLVIDQPEDELDNRFLFETLLPVVQGLKGRRQIIFATHNANIVVNGDADQVIHLEADANHGRIANAGAIEEPRIRDAVVRTVDGGEEAFRVRRLKYGF